MHIINPKHASYTARDFPNRWEYSVQIKTTHPCAILSYTVSLRLLWFVLWQASKSVECTSLKSTILLTSSRKLGTIIARDNTLTALLTMWNHINCNGTSPRQFEFTKQAKTLGSVWTDPWGYWKDFRSSSWNNSMLQPIKYGKPFINLLALSLSHSATIARIFFLN